VKRNIDYYSKKLPQEYEELEIKDSADITTGFKYTWGSDSIIMLNDEVQEIVIKDNAEAFSLIVNNNVIQVGDNFHTTVNLLVGFLPQYVDEKEGMFQYGTFAFHQKYALILEEADINGELVIKRIIIKKRS